MYDFHGNITKRSYHIIPSVFVEILKQIDLGRKYCTIIYFCSERQYYVYSKDVTIV